MGSNSKACCQLEHTLGIIEKYQVNPQFLNLEITETLVMNDMKLSLYLLSKFKELGVRINVDDFGKGYSSLAYLRTFPIDTLKIDRDCKRS